MRKNEVALLLLLLESKNTEGLHRIIEGRCRIYRPDKRKAINGEEKFNRTAT